MAGGERAKGKILFAVILTFPVLAFAIPVYADENATEEVPPELPFGVIHGIWALAVATPMGFLIAFATCAAGYLSKTDPGSFKLANFLYTALISIIIGMITVLSGLPQESVAIWITSWLANGYITWYIWKLTKILAGIAAKKQMFQQPTTGPPKT